MNKEGKEKGEWKEERERKGRREKSRKKGRKGRRQKGSDKTQKIGHAFRIMAELSCESQHRPDVDPLVLLQ